MIQWEYKGMPLRGDTWGDDEEVMNHYGADGWELVAVATTLIKNQGMTLVAYFKRQIGGQDGNTGYAGKDQRSGGASDVARGEAERRDSG